MHSYHILSHLDCAVVVPYKKKQRSVILSEDNYQIIIRNENCNYRKA